MPQENYTAKILDLEDAIIEDIKCNADTIELCFSLERRDHVCPKCSSVTNIVHDYRVQKVKDLPIQGKNTVWYYRKRRYRCPVCAKRFYEKNPLLPKRHRITNRTVFYCMKEMEKRKTLKDIATEAGVSQSSVHRWLRLTAAPKATKLPRVLSIDEFKGNANDEKFQCILTDPTEKAIVDILPSRKSVELSKYFRELPNRERVEYFVMDMNKVYLDIAKTWFPKAKIIIDRFHVVRFGTWALENVRKRIQKSLLPEDRKYFKRSRKLLLARSSELNEENKDALSVMLSYSSDLRTAYYLKEKFYEFMDQNSSREAEIKLKEFMFNAQVFSIPEFKPCLTMLRNWYRVILNSFDCPYSNGYTEGVNNSIKVLKRIAFGYRNFDNFRTRILLMHNANRGVSKLC